MIENVISKLKAIRFRNPKQAVLPLQQHQDNPIIEAVILNDQKERKEKEEREREIAGNIASMSEAVDLMG